MTVKAGERLYRRLDRIERTPEPDTPLRSSVLVHLVGNVVLWSTLALFATVAVDVAGFDPVVRWLGRGQLVRRPQTQRVSSLNACVQRSSRKPGMHHSTASGSMARAAAALPMSAPSQPNCSRILAVSARAAGSSPQ